MGLFGKIFGSELKQDSIDLLEKLLSQTFTSLIIVDTSPKEIATKLINISWNKNPDLFEARGAYTKKPFKLSVVCYSLAYGYNSIQILDKDVRNAIGISLAALFEDLKLNAKSYPISSIDMELLRESDLIFKEVILPNLPKIDF